MRRLPRGPAGKLGSGYQASVQLYTTSIGDVVVKTPHRGGPLGAVALVAATRATIYARLGGVAGIPRSFGLVDGGSLDSSTSRDRRCATTRRRTDREAFFAKLRATLDAMHAAGVAHGDLKRKDNIIVGPGEQPYLIDFGIAVRRRRRAGCGTAWYSLGRANGLNAWVKLKYGRRVDPESEPGVLSAADAAIGRP